MLPIQFLTEALMPIAFLMQYRAAVYKYRLSGHERAQIG